LAAGAAQRSPLRELKRSPDPLAEFQGRGRGENMMGKEKKGEGKEGRGRERSTVNGRRK